PKFTCGLKRPYSPDAMNIACVWVAPVPSRLSLSPVGKRRSSAAAYAVVLVRYRLYLARRRMSPSPVAEPLSELTLVFDPDDALKLWVVLLSPDPNLRISASTLASMLTFTIGTAAPTSKRGVTP